jgi:hypothetical protein
MTSTIEARTMTQVYRVFIKATPRGDLERDYQPGLD